MVTRILKYEANVPADATDFELDSKSPGSGKQFIVQEVYGTADDEHSFSLVYEERKLFDNIRGDRIADEDNGIPFDVVLAESEDLAILATDENSSANDAVFYVRVSEETV